MRLQNNPVKHLFSLFVLLRFHVIHAHGCGKCFCSSSESSSRKMAEREEKTSTDVVLSAKTIVCLVRAVAAHGKNPRKVSSEFNFVVHSYIVFI